MAVDIQKRLFTCAEYETMLAAGILSEDDRVELIEGEILQMSPIGSPHAGCINRVNRVFAPLVGRTILSVQNPLRLNDLSEPQPDFVLLRPREDFYADSHPGPEDVLLLVEVADASLGFDRRVKAPLYALNGIAELWIVDLLGRAVEVYRHPSPRGYQEVRRYERGDLPGLLAFPDLSLTVEEVLG
ncbi:MAG TPA: Uma2 family endonuclease [Thermoanaerobaculia bacterium]|jgi:Uma2 family endonuclease|nr:Uma2 family endonuclease [Thermoanaerobaculia bacterium]